MKICGISFVTYVDLCADSFKNRLRQVVNSIMFITVFIYLFSKCSKKKNYGRNSFLIVESHCMKYDH